MEKELAQSDLPVWKKSQKPPENAVFQKSDILDVQYGKIPLTQKCLYSRRDWRD